MKKLYAIALTTLLLVSGGVMANDPPDAEKPDGAGTPEDPYKVKTVEHLLFITHRGDLEIEGANNSTTTYSQAERWSAVYEQTEEDIDFGTASPTIQDWDDGKGWLPIGIDVSAGFTGIYDGKGNTITGLFINRDDEDNVGLFGHLGEGEGDAAEIRNVRLEDVNVTGARAVGSLVGRVTGDQNTLIIGCSATGAGDNRSVTGDAAVGGLVGSSNSHREQPGNVDVNPLISRSWADIDVTFSDKEDVNDPQKFGGLAGCSQRGRIFDCYALGKVTVETSSYTGDDVERIGGLVGCILTWGQIQRSFSTGEVIIDGNVDEDTTGGLLGNFDVRQGAIENSYWNTETSGQISSAGDGEGVTGLEDGTGSGQFGNQESWEGFDFTDDGAWQWDDDNNQPALRDVPAISNIKWKGASDTSWSADGNWEGDRIPGPNDVVIIPATTSPYPEIISDDGLQSIQRLIIESGASLTLETGARLTVERGLTNENGTGGLVLKPGASLVNNTSDVQATMENKIDGGGEWEEKTTEWYYIAAPVVDQDIEAAMQEAFPNGQDATDFDLYRWSEEDDLWINYHGNDFARDDFFSGEGYIFGASEQVTLTFAGTLGSGDIQWAGLTNTGDGSGGDEEDEGYYTAGWHLLGNPYPSGIIDEGWTKEGFVETLKIWDNGSYIDQSGGFIPANTAFFMQVNEGAATNTLIIPPTARAHEAPSTKTTPQNRILLVAKAPGSEMRQQQVIRLEPDAAEGFDPRYDSRFMAGYAPQLFSITETDRLSTLAIPEITDDLVIPMVFRKNHEGEDFLIHLERNIDETEIYLHDLKTGSWHELGYDKPYAFTAEEDDDPIRFELHFSPPDDDDPVDIDETPEARTAEMWFHDDRLYVETTEAGMQLTIYDLNGRALQTNQPGLGPQSYHINLPPGAYIARLNGKDTHKTLKIITTNTP